MTGIFINYRREDAPGVAGRLYDHLARSFSHGEIFIDVDAMKPGLDFVKQLDSQVSQCDAVLAIIGPHWLDAADSKGKRRLDDNHDYVRIEIASALKRDIPVIPVLVDGAEMPAEADLPEDLASLARRHALELRHTRFASDADAVVSALHTVLPKPRRSRVLPIAAAVVVGLILMVGAIWWIGKSTPGTQTASTTTPPPAPIAQPSPVQPALPFTPQPQAVTPPPVATQDFGGLLDKNANVPNNIANTPNLPEVPAPSTDASSGQVPGVQVALGASFDRVSAAYPSGRQTTVSEKPAWWAQSDGLYFFFGNDKVLDNIRLDPPYSGSVHGVRLGDSFDDVRAKLGEPLRSWDFGSDKANLYQFGDTNVRFDVNPNGKVGTIFVMSAN
jgi:hypothetical protein